MNNKGPFYGRLRWARSICIQFPDKMQQVTDVCQIVYKAMTRVTFTTNIRSQNKDVEKKNILDWDKINGGARN